MGFLAEMTESEERQKREREQAKRAHGRPRSTGVGCRQLAMRCQSCGFIARASRGAIERCGRPTCACGRELSLDVELEELEAAGENELARAREDRRAQASAERERVSGFETRSVQCGVCKRFKSRPADVCEYCGDDPVTFGPDEERERRNYNRAYGYAG